ncbi:ladinin-1-like [Polyodon spathula]|uniref:ladinin-1-like n=1 Tax=Polyodon spathula TaxID=7913 RepID=UPI001B7DDAC7|nr:ladinin-1-like [Polyodon spathula]
MSISRKNWSALSSLTRQWTVEDEEEVERERRRRIRSASTTTEPPDSSSNEPGEQKPHSAQDQDKVEEADPENLAFLEMLKTRDERRKKRHLETVTRQKEEPSSPEPEREGQGGRVEAEGERQRARVAVESKAQREGQGGRLDTKAQKDSTGRSKSRMEGAGTETVANHEPVKPPRNSPSSAQDQDKVEEADPENLAFLEMLKTRDERRKKRHLETLMRQKEEPSSLEGNGGRVEAEGERQRGRMEAKGEGQRGRVAVESKAQREGQGGRLDTEAQKDSMGGVQRVLRNSTGLEKSRIDCAGTETVTNHEPVKTPIKSPSGKFVSSLSISLDKSQEFPAETKNLSSPTTPVGTTSTPRERRFRTEGAVVEEVQIRNLPSRATSFRVTSRSEDPTSRFNRSSSLRIPSRTKEEKTERLPKQETTRDEESTPPFQRNSKLRISSRTIEEKLERLALAAQKSDQVKSPPASRKDCFLFADEVARKRGVFEREATSVERNSATGRKDNLDFSTGISERINRWISKAQRSEKSPGPTDLRKVDISSKRNLWENRAESSSAYPSKS